MMEKEDWVNSAELFNFVTWLTLTVGMDVQWSAEAGWNCNTIVSAKCWSTSGSVGHIFQETHSDAALN